MSESKSASEHDVTAFEKWELPIVKSGHGQGPMTAGEIEKLQKEAYQEGFKQGYKDGAEKGEEEGRRQSIDDMHHRCQLLDSLINTMHVPLEQIDREVTNQLAELAISVARHIIRRELRADPGQVVAVVREAMEALPTGAQEIKIYLHPEDASLVRSAFSLADSSQTSERPWQIVDDPVITRGDCRIQADQSYIDATVETRLNRIIANLLGGDRENDSDS